MHLQGLRGLAFSIRYSARVSQACFGTLSCSFWSREGGPVVVGDTIANSLNPTNSESLYRYCFLAPVKPRHKPSHLPGSSHRGIRLVHAFAEGEATLSSERRKVLSLTTDESIIDERSVPRTGPRLKFLAALSNEQAHQVAQFVDALLEWNQKFNLTAVTERGAVLERHIEDSLALLPHIEQSSALTECLNGRPTLRVVDVGTGAGLPGLILAIVRPEWKVTLVESLRKRCDFLRHVIVLTGLTNTHVVWARAEDAGRDESLREAHDVAVARAVADMRTLSELCLPLVAVGGLFVAPKGAAPEAEVAAAETAVQVLGGRLLAIQSVASEGPQGLRSVVIYAKETPTPPKYPRRAGLPAKRPL